MKVILNLAFILYALSITNCDNCNFAKGVRNDSKRIFKSKKDFFLNLKVKGVIDSKKQCNNCNVNRYQITIKLDNFKVEDVNFTNRFNNPYYIFNENEMLVISVSKTLFELLNEQDIVVKDSNSLFIKFRNYNILLLSKNELEWLPEEDKS